MAKRQNKGTVVYEYLEVFGVELNQRFGGEQTTKDILRHLVERGLVDPKRLMRAIEHILLWTYL